MQARRLHSMEKFRSVLASPLAALSVAVALASSGCRLGNRIVKATDPTAMSGFYSTQAKAMTLCAFVEGKPPGCSAAELTLIPASIQSVLTNPVYVAANTTTTKAYLVPNSLDTSAVFEMILDRSGKLTSEPLLDDPAPFWTDPACISQIQVQKEGMILKSAVAAPSSNPNFALSGSVDFSVGVLTVLGSSCSANLSQMKDCYQNSTLCPAGSPQEQQADHQAVRSFLDPYILRGALAIEDLPGLQGLGWQVDYGL